MNLVVGRGFFVYYSVPLNQPMKRTFILVDPYGNPVPGSIHKRNRKPVAGNWVELGACVPTLTIQTFLNEATPSYPVGVWNTSKTFLGIANNATEYANLWNSDVTNTAYGQISPIQNNSTTFYFIGQNKPKLFGLRYFTFNAKNVNIANATVDGIILPKDAIVQVNNALYSVTSLTGLPFNLGQIDGILFETGMDQVTPMIDISGSTRIHPFPQIDVDPTVYKEVKVFHNEHGGVGFHFIQSFVKDTAGNLPKHMKFFSSWGSNMSTQNIKLQNFLNWSELDSLQSLTIQDQSALVDLKATVANVSFTNIYKTLFSFGLYCDTGTNGLDGWGVDKMINLNKIHTRNVRTSPAANFAANYPKNLQFVLLNMSPSTTSADADAIAIAAANKLKGVVPKGTWKRMYFARNIASPYTAASAAARSELMAAGWNVN